MKSLSNLKSEGGKYVVSHLKDFLHDLVTHTLEQKEEIEKLNRDMQALQQRVKQLENVK